MKVFVVWDHGAYGYFGAIIAVFSSEEKAEQFCKKHYNDFYDIEEKELDNPGEKNG